MKTYYGLKLHSTMCDVESYFLADTKETLEKIFNKFNDYLDGEDESKVKAWEDFCYSYDMTWCSEDNNYKVGQLENNLYCLVSDGYNNEPDKAYIFELVKSYKDRF